MNHRAKGGAVLQVTPKALVAPVTQADLLEVRELRSEYRQARKRWKDKETQLRNRIRSGAPVEEGLARPRISEVLVVDI
jgi:hypothetical protein